MSQSTDRNLLFVVLALQRDLLSGEALIQGLNAWALDKAAALADLLVERAGLSRHDRAVLEALLDKYLERHGGDTDQVLASIRQAGPVRLLDLGQIADHAVRARLSGWDRDFPPTCHKESPGPVPAPPRALVPVVPQPASTGRRYRILRAHDRGSLGEVFVAHDEELGREVALKEIQQQHADKPASRARFVREAVVTGGLEHPGIVPVYGLGAYPDDRPYYAMRFIKGDDLQTALRRFHQADQRQRDPEERNKELRELLGRFVAVCNAVAYANSQGVLHRDLKPANVMLGPYGETLVVDWGLARMIGRAEDASDSAESALRPESASDFPATKAGAILGTPAFMSPEQAAGRLEQLGQTSDVYSLGAILYVLLTGQVPFAGNDVSAILERVKRGAFPTPRQVKRSVPAALEAVCLKALALRPEDRYGSAKDLRDDVERWFAGDPVRAYREPWTVTWGRWCKRHKALVSAAAVGIVVALVVVSVAAMLLADSYQAEREARQKADDAAEEKEKARAKAKESEIRATLLAVEESKARQRAEANHYTTCVALATNELAAGNVAGADQLLAECRLPLRGWEWAFLKRQCHAELFAPLLHHTNPVTSLAFSADGRRLASASGDSQITVWDAQTGQELRTFQSLTLFWSKGLALSPDGTAVVTGGGEGTVRLWDAATGKERQALAGHQPQSHVYAVCYSPDGKRVVSAGGDHTAKVWDLHEGKRLVSFAKHREPVRAVTFAADGRTVFSADEEGVVAAWDAETGQERLHSADQPNKVNLLALSPAGTLVASVLAEDAETVRIRDVIRGRVTTIRRAHAGAVTSLAFRPDGRFLATGGDDRVARVWDVATGRERRLFRGHTGKVTGLAFSRDGRRLASGGGERSSGEVKIWSTNLEEDTDQLAGHKGHVHAVAFSPDSRLLASGGADGTVRVWEVRGRKLLHTLTGHAKSVHGVAFHPDGALLASASGDGTIRLWDVATAKEHLRLEGHTGGVAAVAFSRDGTRLASTGEGDHQPFQGDRNSL